MNQLFKEFYENPPTDAKLAITIDVTNQCQLNCVYCYFGEKGVKTINVSKGLNAYTNLIKIFAGKVNGVIIHFMGGEPLLAWKSIKTFHQKAQKIAESNNIPFEWSITSNLVALDKEKTNYIIKNNGRVHCSLDGDPKTQLENRPHKSGSDYTETLYTGITNALTIPRSDFARVTVTPSSVHNLPKVANFFWEKGFKSIGVFPAVNLTWRKNDIDMWKKNLHEIFLNSPNDKNITTIIGDHRMKEKTCNTYCGAGRGLWSINVNGDIGFCHHFSNDTNIPIIDGSITPKETLKLILNSSFPPNPKMISEGCLECEIFQYCSGGCWANAYYKSGEKFTPHNTECALRKASYEIIDKELLPVTENIIFNGWCSCKNCDSPCDMFLCNASGNTCEGACNALPPTPELPIKEVIS